jgi:hypothetical protein
MFEYWLHGVGDESCPYIYTSTTHDFLQVCADIAKHYSPGILGEFVAGLFEEHSDKLDFIRVVNDWNFEFDWGTKQKITLRKVA